MTFIINSYNKSDNFPTNRVQVDTKHVTHNTEQKNPPFIERFLFCVVLQTTFIDEELHPFEEGGGDGGRLFPKEDVYRFGRGYAELAALTGGTLAALRVFTVYQTVCG